MAHTVLLEQHQMQPKLLIEANGVLGECFFPAAAVIGRLTPDNLVDIDLKEKFVSRRHAEVGYDSYGCFYIDTNSKNGTYYNGQRLMPDRKQYLNHGDTLHIFDATGQNFVVMIFLTDYPQAFSTGVIPLTPETAEINIGRTGYKNVLLGADTVSANHASFFVADRGWALVDHNSTNGVYLNNTRLTAPRYMRVGDCIRICNVHFFYCGDKILYQNAPVQPAAAQSQNPNYPMTVQGGAGNTALDIHIVERSVWQRTKKLMLLQNINMTINAGEMVLILGGSGAGKTTFMNAVMGYEKAEGKIMHGDTDIYEDFESMKYKIGFVPQQDLLRGSDTVYDTLENAAQMKLSRSVRKAEREQRIEKVLETLGLQRERNSLVSKLSGGQRKRLSIAVEYIADPSLFFLDEPDSGLDGIMAKTLMHNLRTIADEGKIVMVISHGPDRAAELFNKVIVLAKSVRDNCGHLAFFGTVEEAYAFFEVSSLEDVVRRINREDEGGDGLSDFYIEKYNRAFQ